MVTQDQRVSRSSRILTAQRPAAVRRLRPLHATARSRTSPGGRSTRATTPRSPRSTANGLVRTLAMSGEAAVMARYQGQVAVFRATVPLGHADAATTQFAAKTVVDKLHRRRSGRSWASCPSDLCTDEQFIRRVVRSTSPARCRRPKQVRRSSPTRTPDKRDKLIDELLEIAGVHLLLRQQVGRRPAREAAAARPSRAAGTFAFHDWIREAIAADKPYDEFVRDDPGGDRRRGEEPADGLVQGAAERPSSSSTTRPRSSSACGWPVPSAITTRTRSGARTTTGAWPPSSAGSAARTSPVPGGWPEPADQQRSVIFTEPSGTRDQQADRTAGRDQAARRRADGGRRRRRPAAQAGRLDGGPEEPVLRPGGGQPLLGALLRPRHRRSARRHARDQPAVATPSCSTPWPRTWSTHKYSLKHLVKTICKSRTYQLSAVPNEFNKHDKQNYARYYPKRMAAEVLFDAVCQVTDSPAAFDGLPPDKHAPNRAIMLPDESFASYFLDVFGRPQRISACECERVSEANLAQALHLLNSRRGAGQARPRRRPGRRCWPRTRGRTPRRSRSCSCWAFARKPTADAAERWRWSTSPSTRKNKKVGLREHPVGAAEHQGVRVQSVRSVPSAERHPGTATVRERVCKPHPLPDGRGSNCRTWAVRSGVSGRHLLRYGHVTRTPPPACPRCLLARLTGSLCDLHPPGGTALATNAFPMASVVSARRTVSSVGSRTWVRPQSPHLALRGVWVTRCAPTPRTMRVRPWP